jgi:hypothetical protein
VVFVFLELEAGSVQIRVIHIDDLLQRELRTVVEVEAEGWVDLEGFKVKVGFLYMLIAHYISESVQILLTCCRVEVEHEEVDFISKDMISGQNDN